MEFIRSVCGRLTTDENVYAQGKQKYFKDTSRNCVITKRGNELVDVLKVRDVGIDKSNNEVLVIERFKGNYIYWTDGTSTHKSDIGNFEFITQEQYLLLIQKVV